MINRRTQILIEPYKQLKFGIMFLLLNIIFSLLAIFIFGYFLQDIYFAIIEYFRLDATQSSQTASKFAKPAYMFLGVIVCFIGTTLYCSVYYTHSFYGPMVSIRRFLDDLLAGKRPEAIHLRESDQLHDLANRLNNVLDLYSGSPSSSSVAKIDTFLNSLLEGKDVAPLALAADDPLSGVAKRLNDLAKRQTDSR